MTLTRRALGVVALTIGVLVSTTDAHASTVAKAKPRKFTLSSPAFRNGGTIPDGFTCAGPGASPPLRWKHLPKRTKDLALTVEDPDAPGRTFVHWVAWGIDPGAGSLPEETIPATVHQGSTTTGQTKYFGPCPPPGSEPHHYIFTLYALSKPVSLPDGASITELRAAISSTTLRTAKLVGRFGR